MILLYGTSAACGDDKACIAHALELSAWMSSWYIPEVTGLSAAFVVGMWVADLTRKWRGL